MGLLKKVQNLAKQRKSTAVRELGFLARQYEKLAAEAAVREAEYVELEEGIFATLAELNGKAGFKHQGHKLVLRGQVVVVAGVEADEDNDPAIVWTVFYPFRKTPSKKVTSVAGTSSDIEDFEDSLAHALAEYF